MKKEKISLAIVDDHQIVIDGIKSLLFGHPDFVVQTECTQPEKMLNLLADHPVDILLTDIMMPRVNGIGLVRWIRNDPSFASVPIIAMTAYGDNFLTEAKRAGATRTIHKPEDIPDLAHIVSSTLNQSRPTCD